MNLTIGYLYGDLMNIYGDWGNIIALKKRAEWRGIKVKIINISLGAKLFHPEGGRKADLYFFGGGQDQEQQLVSRDLISSIKGKIIKQEVERGVPLLAICGGYQLLGEYYKPHKGPKLPGIGLFPAYTIAGNKRMIGNIVVKPSAIDVDYFSLAPKISFQSSDKKQSDDRRPVSTEGWRTDDFLVGFENHSGQTFLKKGANPLGMVLKGFGNNGEDKSEGCIYKNAIGCYMHGSLLPKNPKLADWLLKKALEVKYGKEINLEPLDNSLELKAHQNTIRRLLSFKLSL